MLPQVTTPHYTAYSTRPADLYAGQSFDVQMDDGSIALIRSNGQAWQYFGAAAPVVSYSPTYVYLGTWAARPAASGLNNGDRVTITDLAANGGVCEFEVRTVSAVKYFYPVGEITLAVAGATISGTSGNASTLASPLVGPLTGAAAGTFLTLAGLIPAGLLTPPHLRLRVEMKGKKTGTGGIVAYAALLDSQQFGAAVSGSGNGQDLRADVEVLTTPGLALGSGSAGLNGSASQQAVPMSLNNAAAQSVTLGYTSGNAADSQNLYAYRISVSA